MLKISSCMEQILSRCSWNYGSSSIQHILYIFIGRYFSDSFTHYLAWYTSLPEAHPGQNLLNGYLGQKNIYSRIYFRNEDPYIYTVLDWRNAGRTTGICFLVLLFIIVLHCFSSCVYLLRIYVYRKFHSSTQCSSDKEKKGIENTAMTDFPV